MLRLKVTAVSLVVLGALLFGSVVAYAGWGWNAKIDVGGTTVRTAWTTQHNHSGSTSDISAKITVVVPIGANVAVLESAPNETILLESSAALSCTENGIETIVKYEVSHSGDAKVKDRVRVVVSTPEDHQRLAAAKGVWGETISVNVVIAGNC